MDVTSIAGFGYVIGLLSVGVVALIVGIRLGARSRAVPAPSEEEQVAAAFGVLKRHFEKTALADLRASGAPLWTPDPARIAALSYGVEDDAHPVSDNASNLGRRSARHP